ncbi:MAG: carbohydrate kinase, partial [Gammaproteobacteria bacterium]|nr:carbohydrate kinase [Gammaproteobacteria bacterium]
IDTSLVQLDAALPTGEARATLDATGSARYEFLTPAAWDALVATPELLGAASSCDAFVYGTLGQRDPRARASITQLAAAARWRAFDLNLRAPHVSRELCEAGLRGAALVKINEEELRLLSQWYGCEGTPEALWEALAPRFAPGALCVTLGATGSQLNWQGRWYRQAATPVEVVDTVGAGDSFLALLVCELLRGSDAPAALARAGRLASFVASQPGAVPAYDGALFRR